MSDSSKDAVEVIDLAENSSGDAGNTPGSEKPAKKLKQLRLPFAPIQKNAEKPVSKPDEEKSVKKRKLSEELSESNKKPALDDSDVQVPVLHIVLLRRQNKTEEGILTEAE